MILSFKYPLDDPGFWPGFFMPRIRSHVIKSLSKRFDWQEDFKTTLSLAFLSFCVHPDLRTGFITTLLEAM
jgi:hypothetical protein